MTNNNLFTCDFCNSENLIEVHYGLFRCVECGEYISTRDEEEVDEFYEAKKNRRFRTED
jgi:predicted RNA-binding Zn-ribbon protein involved in translation (DUF1610 family)